ncbi:hypothetical protein DL98DRAFT_516438 [Cadophora sp. DSE1049]|nr:hypothetical protein DL98DRAFT_516438 [Cadophora sp. DSE1049]
MLINAIIVSSLLVGGGFAQMSMPSGTIDHSMTMDPSMTMATSSMDPSMTMATSSMDPSMTMTTSTTSTMEMPGISSGTQGGGISSTSSIASSTASSAVTSTNAASGSANSVQDLFAGIGLVTLAALGISNARLF